MKDVDRREFFKKCYKIGGFAAIAGLGMGSVKEAMGWGILPAVIGSGAAAASYATWKENTEIVSYSAVWLMESGAAANETGVDSRAVPLTGADLVATQAGALAAATGSPPTRAFDGTDDWMSWTPTGYDVVSNGTSVWTLIVKGLDITEAQTAGHTQPIYLYESANQKILGVYDGIWQIWETVGNQIISTTLVTPVATSGVVYACFFSDGTYVRCGWTASGSGANGQPTKWSDFPANQRLTATATCTWANGSFSSTLYGLMRFNLQYTAGKISYLLMSDTCLIDNAA